jgi:hypothetical protein
LACEVRETLSRVAFPIVMRCSTLGPKTPSADFECPAERRAPLVSPALPFVFIRIAASVKPLNAGSQKLLWKSPFVLTPGVQVAAYYNRYLGDSNEKL